MKFLIAPVALFSMLALSACGGAEQAEAPVERQAASSATYTLCVKNDSSRTISSTGDGSPSQPEGFLLPPGKSGCTTTAAGATQIKQSMMSDVGPSWTTSLAVAFEYDFTLETALRTTSFSTCGRVWPDAKPISASLSCSGNPFRVSVKFNSSGAAYTADVTFSDE